MAHPRLHRTSISGAGHRARCAILMSLVAVRLGGICGFLQWRNRGPSDRELANRSLDAQVAVIHAEGKQGYGRIRVTCRLRQSTSADFARGARRMPSASLRTPE
jgi:hypothetical protein